MSLTDKMQSGMNAIERAITGLPGIEEYKAKECRRDADRRVRETLARLLEDQRSRLTGLQLDLLSGGGLDWLDNLERAVGKLQLLIDRVKTAAYGYAGFFDAEKVREAELDALTRFDRAMIERVSELQAKIDAVQQAVETRENLPQAIRELIDLLEALNQQWRHRDEAMSKAAEE